MWCRNIKIENMKKQKLNNLNLGKKVISNLAIKGGAINTINYQNVTHQNVPINYDTGHVCLQNSNWCRFSEIDSCYSPCGGPHGTIGCNG